MRQIGILFLYLDEFTFIADDDDPTERVWADEKSAIAELAKEGWEITSGPARIEPDLPAMAERNVVGYRMECTVQ